MARRPGIQLRGDPSRPAAALALALALAFTAPGTPLGGPAAGALAHASAALAHTSAVLAHAPDALAHAAAAAPGRGAAAPGAISRFEPLTPLAFTPDGDGRDDVVAATYRLSVAALVTVEVVDWQGAVVRTLLPPRELRPGNYPARWSGSGQPDGPYRLRVTAEVAPGQRQVRELVVARVRARAYPQAPGTVTVFLDPGHGGSDDGATDTAPDGATVAEKDFDLDIAARLAAMLRASGLRVSMSRTTDVDVNRAGIDRNGDGVVDGTDELQARIDGANSARADLFVGIHNNWLSGGRGRTEAFYCGQGCPGSSASRALAADVLAAHTERLATLQDGTWQMTVGDPAIPADERNPTDDVLRFGFATLPAGRHFYVLGPFGGTFRPRATQMPGVLMESLALSNPAELGLLRQPAVRTLLADAYYDGIARWLASREFGARLDPVGPAPNPAAGRPTVLAVRLTNNGNEAIAPASRLTVGSLAPASPYDGTGATGLPIGSVAIGRLLAPGRSMVVRVPVVPPTPGAALWKVDLLLADGRRASSLRMPPLQLHVTVAR